MLAYAFSSKGAEGSDLPVLEVLMKRVMSGAALTLAVAALCISTITPVRAEDDRSKAPACSLKITKGLYGFQCHGSAFTGAKFEPVTFIGTVESNGRGLFDGYGTFNSSNGSANTHVKGPGTLSDRCFGHVEYTNELLLDGGGVVPLDPISFDYTVVNGGDEILGTGRGFPGATGDFVPRLTCRLVRIK